MSSFTDIKNNVRSNLVDAAVTFYPVEDIDASVQDAYDDVVARTRCIIRRVTLDWPANQSYLNFSGNLFGVDDFLGVIAIKNNVTNRWLEDNYSLRDLDGIRYDWELATGTPQIWVPAGGKYTAIFPHYAEASVGTLDLIYWAKAPDIAPLIAEDDTVEPEIPTDMQHLIELYSTPDLLEQAEEITSAVYWWKQYFDDKTGIPAFARRCRNLARADFAARI